MLDVITNRIQHVCVNHDSQVRENVKLQLSVTGLRRYGYQYRQNKRIQEKSILKERLLLKDQRWEDPFPPPKLRPFVGLCCSTCTPSSRNSLVTKAAKSLNVRNILLVDALNYRNGFLTRKLCHLATVWGLKKHDGSNSGLCDTMVLVDYATLGVLVDYATLGVLMDYATLGGISGPCDTRGYWWTMRHSGVLVDHATLGGIGGLCDSRGY
uniref:Uncharacterized protein n=1 Tax=Timema bartmani TaxID=61472 RepID=A0A7R9F573_9NEOP|nr:unnamed protein product [Timema bartmani]